MKINEIVTEGALDFAKGLWNTKSMAGAKAANQQAQTLKQSNKELGAATTDALKSYNKFLASYTAAGKQATPEIASQWLAKYLGRAPETKPVGVNVNQLRPWITQELGNYFSSKQLGTQQTQATQPAQPATVPSAILGPDGNPIQKSTAPAAPPAPAASPQIIVPPGSGARSASQTPQTYQSPLGIIVRQASDAGITLVYKNRNFMLNNRGEWALDGKDTAGATAAAQIQAEMDKVAQSTGFME